MIPRACELVKQLKNVYLASVLCSPMFKHVMRGGQIHGITLDVQSPKQSMQCPLPMLSVDWQARNWRRKREKVKQAWRSVHGWLATPTEIYWAGQENRGHTLSKSMAGTFHCPRTMANIVRTHTAHTQTLYTHTHTQHKQTLCYALLYLRCTLTHKGKAFIELSVCQPGQPENRTARESYCLALLCLCCV